MKNIQTLSHIAALAAVMIASGCASHHAMLEPVGPDHPSGRIDGPEGRLIAYTARERYTVADVPYSHPTSYRIHSADGKLIKYVSNNSRTHDSHPEFVSLKPGLYSILANSERAGLVSVPVVIESLKTTEVHLEHDWRPPANGRNHAEMVHSPKGEPVGWRVAIGALEDIDEEKAKRADLLVKVKLVQAPDRMGKLAYALVEPVMVLRNKTATTIDRPFTVGFTDITKGVAPGISTVYLTHAQRDDGTREWRMVE